MTTFDRVTTVVGDLEHPLYADEHRRDVWNEATAVAYQAMSWGLLVGIAVLAWVAPGSSLAIVLMALVIVVPSLGVMAQVQRRGVDPWRVPGTGPVRLGLIALVALATFAGFVVNSRGAGLDVPTALGLTAGAVIGGLVGVTITILGMLALMRLARRRAPRGED